MFCYSWTHVIFVITFQLGNGSLYGTHPPYWYIIAGLPAISGVILPFFIYEVIQTISIKDTQRQKGWWSPQLSLVTIIVSYISFHSISSHKEFRFILPILPLVCILSSCAIDRFLTINESHPKTSTTSQSIKRQHKRVRRRFVLLGTLIFILNYPHLLFLAIIHQRAPIEVNKAITNHIIKLNMMTNQSEDKQYKIHYLMGCHSTPLYSHLHIPMNYNNNGGKTVVDTWTLDCSPHCRINSTCESDDFISNPHRFIMNAYYGGEDNHCENKDIEDLTCQAESNEPDHSTLRPMPNFLAIYDNELYFNDNDDNDYNAKDVIEGRMGMYQIGKFRHSIKSVSIRRIRDDSPRRKLLYFDVHWSNDGILRVGFNTFVISMAFDHMVLFSSVQ